MEVSSAMRVAPCRSWLVASRGERRRRSFPGQRGTTEAVALAAAVAQITEELKTARAHKSQRICEPRSPRGTSPPKASPPHAAERARKRLVLHQAEAGLGKPRRIGRRRINSRIAKEPLRLFEGIARGRNSQGAIFEHLVHAHQVVGLIQRIGDDADVEGADMREQRLAVEIARK